MRGIPLFFITLQRINRRGKVNDTLYKAQHNRCNAILNTPTKRWPVSLGGWVGGWSCDRRSEPTPTNSALAGTPFMSSHSHSHSHSHLPCLLESSQAPPELFLLISTQATGPAHQFDRYYKDGHLDDCAVQLAELRFCFKLKFAGPEESKVSVRL